MKWNRRVLFLLPALLVGLGQQSCAQPTTDARSVPKVYQNITYEDEGRLVLQDGSKTVPLNERPPRWTLDQLRNCMEATEQGFLCDVGDSSFGGVLYYGFMNQEDAAHAYPVFFKRYSRFENGQAAINIQRRLSGKYDMVDWQSRGRGRMGYRITDEKGKILYDGKIHFTGTGPFQTAQTIVEGPTVHQVTSKGAVIAFEALQPGMVELEINGTIYEVRPNADLRYEQTVTGLEPETHYRYQLRYDGFEDSYYFHTAPEAGSREPFVFAYASDSRAGQGGGERNIHGANAYIMKRIFALAHDKEARFLQFTGDLINGYLSSEQETRLQFANWKQTVAPYAHYFPYYANMGNHEALIYEFGDRYASVDQFPFETQSAEALFARAFTNPLNGPLSEDGSALDPDPSTVDFPTYKENAYHYRYDHVAVVVLNSDYFYAPSTSQIPLTGGNPHGYIMDNQLRWLDETLDAYENDPTIDHVFVTQHTPAFPNGGHVDDDMWYNGSNEARPYAAGQPAEEGIIERRDAYLDILVNQHQKVRAILTGDEHNFNYMRIDDEMPRYPDQWDKEKLTLKRPIFQINNGAAGAPYYAQEPTPWSSYCQGFSTQNALVLFEVSDKGILVKVYNPDTLELFEQFELK